MNCVTQNTKVLLLTVVLLAEFWELLWNMDNLLTPDGNLNDYQLAFISEVIWLLSIFQYYCNNFQNR